MADAVPFWVAAAVGWKRGTGRTCGFAQPSGEGVHHAGTHCSQIIARAGKGSVDVMRCSKVPDRHPRMGWHARTLHAADECDFFAMTPCTSVNSASHLLFDSALIRMSLD